MGRDNGRSRQKEGYYYERQEEEVVVEKNKNAAAAAPTKKEQDEEATVNDEDYTLTETEEDPEEELPTIGGRGRGRGGRGSSGRGRGRPPGSKNKRTAESREESVEQQQKKKRRKKHPEEPVKKSAFHFYMDEVKAQYSLQNPGMKLCASDLNRAGGEAWRGMDGANRRPYIQKSEARKKEYDAWMESGGRELVESLNNQEGDRTEKEAAAAAETGKEIGWLRSAGANFYNPNVSGGGATVVHATTFHNAHSLASTASQLAAFNNPALLPLPATLGFPSMHPATAPQDPTLSPGRLLPAPPLEVDLQHQQSFAQRIQTQIDNQLAHLREFMHGLPPTTAPGGGIVSAPGAIYVPGGGDMQQQQIQLLQERLRQLHQVHQQPGAPIPRQLQLPAAIPAPQPSLPAHLFNIDPNLPSFVQLPPMLGDTTGLGTILSLPSVVNSAVGRGGGVASAGAAPFTSSVAQVHQEVLQAQQIPRVGGMPVHVLLHQLGQHGQPQQQHIQNFEDALDFQQKQMMLLHAMQSTQQQQLSLPQETQQIIQSNTTNAAAAAAGGPAPSSRGGGGVGGTFSFQPQQQQKQ